MGATIKGINVVIEGKTTGLQKALEDVNKKSRDIQRELRQVNKMLKFDPKNTELAAQKQKLLTEAVSNTREKLDRLKNAQEEVNEQFKRGEISEEQYRAFQREVIKTEQELSRLEGQLQKTGTSVKNFGQRMTETGTKLKRVGQQMTEIGKNLTMKLSLPLAAVGGVAIKAGADFEAAMSEVGAISGASGAQMATLGDKAKEMGAKTKFSASEAAEGLKYMSMAGWDTAQMLDGLDGVMMLAAASGEELGAVSDIVTDALTAFGMKASEASSFADLLASASANSNTNVGMMGQTFQYVAPLFGSLGYSAEDAALAIGLMANAGIKGTKAGTSLRSSITRLVNPTGDAAAKIKELGIQTTDSQGKMLPFRDVMDQLRDKFSELSKEQQTQAAATIFGREAMTGMLAIINASDADYAKLTKATRDYTGAAQKMSEEMQDNLHGQIVLLKSALKGLAIKIYEIVVPALRSIVGVVQKIVDAIANLSPGMQKFIVILAGLAIVIPPIITGLGLLAQGIGSIMIVTALFGPQIAALGAGIAAVAGPIAVAVAGFAALGIAIKKIVDYSREDAIPAVNLFGEKTSKATKEAVGGYMELDEKASKALLHLKGVGEHTSDATKKIAAEMGKNFAAMAKQITTGLEKEMNKSLETMKTYIKETESISDAEGEKILEGVRKTYQDRIKEVQEGEARIQEIRKQAAEENRGLRKEELAEIEDIQQKMKDVAIDTLSETEVEAKAIRERIKNQSAEMTAQQAADVVQKSLKMKEEAIKNAEEQYDAVTKEATKLHLAGAISEEVKNKIIKNAEEQKNKQISAAETAHEGVVDEAKKQAEEHVNEVDWETGEVLTKFEAFVEKTKTLISENGAALNQGVEDAGQTLSDLGSDIGSFFGNLGTNAKTWGSNMIENLRTGISEKAGAAQQAATDIGSRIGNVFTTVGGTATSWGANITQRLGGGMRAAQGVASSAAQAIGNVTRRIFEKLGSTDAVQLGRGVVQGLIRGMNQLVANVVQTATNIANSVKNTIKRILGIRSPSKVTEEFGRMVALGLAKGMEENKSEVEKAAEKMAQAIDKAAQTLTTELDRALNLTNAELELMEMRMGEAATEVEKLQIEQRKLAAKKQELAYRVEVLTAAYERSKKELGETNDTTRKYGYELGMARIELNKTEVSIRDTTKAIKEQREETQKAIEGIARDLKTLSNEVTKVEQKYRKDLADAADEYWKKVRDLNQRVREEERATTQAYWNEVNERARALSNFVGLFDEAYPTYDVFGAELLENLRGQVDVFETWQEDIAELAARGVDEGLIEELKELGPKAQPEIAALNTLTDEQLDEYVALWKKKNREAREEAIKQMERQRVETQQKLVQIRQDAYEQLELYRQEWEEKNAEIRKNADEELDHIKERFQDIAESGTTYGVALMANFTRGMRSQFDSLRAALQEAAMIVDSYMPHSPAKVGPLRNIMDWGPALVKALSDGIKKSTPILERAMSGLADKAVPAVPAAAVAGAGTTNNYGGHTFHLHIAPGSSRQQADEIMRELHKRGVRF